VMMSDIETFSKIEESLLRIQFAPPHNRPIGQMRFPCIEGEGLQCWTDMQARGPGVKRNGNMV
jgi:beta-xylosidase